MTKLTTIFCWLCIVMLFAETSAVFWRRRRRRRRRSPTCHASDCTVSSWSGWGSCSYPCGTSGTQSRSRYVTSQASCGGSCPFHLSESQACNRGGCHNYGTPHSTGCRCRAGYTGTCCDQGKF